MDAATLQKFEQMLKALQVELQAEIDAASEAAAPVMLDGSMGRLSRGDAMQAQQMSLEMQRRRQERLIRTQTALLRIREGTYGLCGRCRQPIDEARLETFPDVVLCVRCAGQPRG